MTRLQFFVDYMQSKEHPTDLALDVIRAQRYRDHVLDVIEPKGTVIRQSHAFAYRILRKVYGY